MLARLLQRSLEMQYSAPTDCFRLAYERSGSGAPVVLLHGWPGDHTDWDQLVPGLFSARPTI
jgi:pimeloyl-ACP methyl ester carboxylesterase